MAESVGRISQVLGAVVDVDFSGAHLPEIYDAVRVPRDGGQRDLILEVQTQLGGSVVRAVA
ncbi:MAG TPA: F0F1 ATP synthase subunit beta, partial [Candidatus Limnocylindrales bacterium]|nr:F0F1 ATP synthase subunit beta [Candidatus Limnocylindrales bacterium]